MLSAHDHEDDSDSESAKVRVRAVVRILFGRREIAACATVGEAMALPVAIVPVGSRIVARGLVKAKLEHHVSKLGHLYAGWSFCAAGEKEKAR